MHAQRLSRAINGSFTPDSSVDVSYEKIVRRGGSIIPHIIQFYHKTHLGMSQALHLCCFLGGTLVISFFPIPIKKVVCDVIV